MDQIIGQILEYAVDMVALFSTGWLAGWGFGALVAVLIAIKEKIRDQFDK